MKSAAFFDLDNTIIRGGSLFHLARGLRKQNIFRARDFWDFLWRELRFVIVGKEHSKDTDWIRTMALKFAAGRSVADIQAMAEAVADDYILPKVYEGTHELALAHLERGEEVWIVTASPTRMANLLAQRMGLTGGIGTDAEEVDGIFTGRMLGPVLHGAHKRTALVKFAADRGLDLAECTAYSDSINDLPMLEAVGHPCVVNADRRLRRVARTRGWASYDFRRLRLARRFGGQALVGVMAALVWRRRR